jgi:hypothetical protein
VIKINYLQSNNTSKTTTHPWVALEDDDPRAGRVPREDFALSSIHLDDALALAEQLDNRAFLFSIDVEVTPLERVNGRPALHEQHRTPLFQTPRPKRLDGKRNRIRPAHVERSRVGKLILADKTLTRHQQNNALRMVEWLFGRIDNQTGDVRVICKGTDITTWEPMATSTGTMMLALQPFGMTGSIFDKTARREMGIAKQQHLRDTIRLLKKYDVIIDTATLEAKRRVWQVAPKLAGGNIHVRAALQGRFDNEEAAQRAIGDLQRELNVDVAVGSPLKVHGDMPDDGSVIAERKGRQQRR